MIIRAMGALADMLFAMGAVQIMQRSASKRMRKMLRREQRRERRLGLTQRNSNSDLNVLLLQIVLNGGRSDEEL